MNFPFTSYNIILFCLLFVAIVRFCFLAYRRVGNSSTIQNQETAISETSPQQGAAETDGINPALLRTKVIESIFPGQTVDNNATLVYDAESNSYQWANDKTGDASCSICIESYEPGDVTVSSQCGHVFHRECIMGWLLHHDKVGAGQGGVNNNGQGNDECPHCRQLMWDADTYQLVETELRATWNHSEERT
ncbi:ubiquitin-protein transferase [Fragilaria crotonensis]|nr:ubiquitin-protein transferase [Fragilaria crotonensis]